MTQRWDLRAEGGGPREAKDRHRRGRQQSSKGSDWDYEPPTAAEFLDGLAEVALADDRVALVDGPVFWPRLSRNFQPPDLRHRPADDLRRRRQMVWRPKSLIKRHSASFTA